MKGKKSSGWELTAGVIPGLLFGVRTYEENWRVDHVLYVGFFDLCFTQYYEYDE